MTGGAPKVADAAAVAAAIADAPGWRRAEDGALLFEHRFPSVAEAVGFLVAVALHAERHGHHPETAWTYRDVSLRLVTHDAGDRVTERDLALLEDLVAVLRA
jgi:4a-hydroxytetrahydrobiopterin dehydratase